MMSKIYGFQILVVEDDLGTREFMKSLLRHHGYAVESANDGQEGWERIQAGGIDLIISDIMMPRMDGLDLCRAVKSAKPWQLIPLILCTALNQEADRLEGFKAGADDFISKPINESELLLRLRNFRRVVELQREVAEARARAEERADEKTRELEEMVQTLEIAHAEAAIAQLDVIHRLAAATEYKDSDTGAHIQRIAEYTLILGRCLGWFDGTEAVTVSQASIMHDVGKIGIPDYILMKPGLLTSEEFDEMKKHTVLGWRLLNGSSTRLIQVGAKIARSHHERWDGSGYPDGLKGRDIPAEARIVAVADVFDALRAQRCYKPEYPLNQCFEMIAARAGQHFDPDVVEAFMLCKDDLAAVKYGLEGFEAA